jgi:DNA-binding transcriptional MerR regulator
MSTPRDAVQPASLLHIGEAARELGVTTRTLRYWEEMGLVAPSAHGGGGERLYTVTELERAAHIRELQKLAGLSLGDIRAVLDTEARLDDIRAAYRADASPGSRRQLTMQAIEATEGLLGRIDERLSHLKGFRSRLADKLARRRQHLMELEREEGSRPSRPNRRKQGGRG